MTVQQEVKTITDRLSPRFGAGEAKAMAKLIFENVKGWNSVDLAVKYRDELSDFIIGKIDGVVKRLLDNEPIQYIFGNAWFYGMNLKVTPDTLIPRPETAELVDIIVNDNRRKDLRVMDLCTGSGCIAIALSRNLPFAHVTATDISEPALEVARMNAKALHADIDFRKGNLLKCEYPAGEYDVIVSNPPYIAEKERSAMEPNVVDFEPAAALFVPDDDPLEFYRAIFRVAGKALAPGGKIYLEINPLFVDDLKRLALDSGFSEIDIRRDSFGKERFAIIGR